MLLDAFKVVDKSRGLVPYKNSITYMTTAILPLCSRGNQQIWFVIWESGGQHVGYTILPSTRSLDTSII